MENEMPKYRKDCFSCGLMENGCGTAPSYLGKNGRVLCPCWNCLVRMKCNIDTRCPERTSYFYDHWQNTNGIAKYGKKSM